MIKVGLTGGIGSGKSIVASIFEMLGVPVFYADHEAKVLMESNQELREGIIKLLGNNAFSDNKLNRGYIAAKVFSDPDMLVKLNEIVHPAVHRYFLKWTESFAGIPYVVEEAAILFESGANNYFDYSILVTSPESLRIERVMKRDKVNEENVKARMKNQFPEDKNLSMADFIINNDKDSMILPQILELHERLLSLCRVN
jgi:dephospho-CoA kinase